MHGEANHIAKLNDVAKMMVFNVSFRLLVNLVIV